MKSKAIGEPPLMYGIGVYFALLDALRAFRPDREPFFEAPMTPERVLMFLHGDRLGTEAANLALETVVAEE
jgi:xanthine dehydrogenase large subunit